MFVVLKDFTLSSGIFILRLCKDLECFSFLYCFKSKFPLNVLLGMLN